MPNYFTDNPDLLFHFNNLNIEEIVSIIEDDYRQTKK